MNPNDNIARMRAIVTRMKTNIRRDDYILLGSELADLVADLDAHLSDGGTLPEVWCAKPTKPRTMAQGEAFKAKAMRALAIYFDDDETDGSYAFTRRQTALSQLHSLFGESHWRLPNGVIVSITKTYSLDLHETGTEVRLPVDAKG